MTKTATPNTPAGTRVTVTTGTYEGRTGTVLDHNHGTVDNPTHPNHGRAYLMLALDKTGSDFHNPWTRQFVDDIQVNEEAKEPADTDEPVNFDDVQVGDELTFCNRDNGFGGSGGRIIRPGVVTGKTGKTVTVKVTGSNPLAVPTFTLNSSGRGKDVTYGLTARLRAATWNDRQVRRAKKATPAEPGPFGIFEVDVCIDRANDAKQGAEAIARYRKANPDMEYRLIALCPEHFESDEPRDTCEQCT